jgi:hypothetical protein
MSALTRPQVNRDVRVPRTHLKLLSRGNAARSQVLWSPPRMSIAALRRPWRSSISASVWSLKRPLASVPKGADEFPAPSGGSGTASTGRWPGAVVSIDVNRVATLDAEMVEDLEATLAEFGAIAEPLGEPTATEGTVQ